MSKYVGETVKNPGRVFAGDTLASLLLLFDEADASLTKCTDVGDTRDRHANPGFAYLAQRIERAPGVAILASNPADEIDTAFARGIHEAARLPQPGRGVRGGFWLLRQRRDERAPSRPCAPCRAGRRRPSSCDP